MKKLIAITFIALSLMAAGAEKIKSKAVYTSSSKMLMEAPKTEVKKVPLFDSYDFFTEGSKVVISKDNYTIKVKIKDMKQDKIQKKLRAEKVLGTNGSAAYFNDVNKFEKEDKSLEFEEDISSAIRSHGYGEFKLNSYDFQIFYNEEADNFYVIFDSDSPYRYFAN